ncbi:MAG: hypothetical protein LBH46_02580 [Rickettsiales bacterium]|jgi:hypothetical protein|nr:hypothetical protein [Rickettsiales bacterium]
MKVDKEGFLRTRSNFVCSVIKQDQLNQMLLSRLIEEDLVSGDAQHVHLRKNSFLFSGLKTLFSEQLSRVYFSRTEEADKITMNIEDEYGKVIGSTEIKDSERAREINSFF